MRAVLVLVLAIAALGCKGRKRADCEEAVNHMFDLFDAETAGKLAELPADKRAELEAEGRATREQTLAKCRRGEMTREAHDCIMASTKLSDLAGCPTIAE